MTISCFSPDYDDKSAATAAPEKQRRNSEGTVNDVMLGNKSVIGRLFNGSGAFDHILEAIFLYLVGPFSIPCLSYLILIEHSSTRKRTIISAHTRGWFNSKFEFAFLPLALWS